MNIRITKYIVMVAVAPSRLICNNFPPNIIQLKHAIKMPPLYPYTPTYNIIIWHTDKHTHTKYLFRFKQSKKKNEKKVVVCLCLYILYVYIMFIV